MKLLCLERAGIPPCESPTIDDVLGVMRDTVLEEDPPEFAITAAVNGHEEAMLQVILLFDVTDEAPAGWFVRFKKAADESSRVLASNRPNDSTFLNYYMCGCEESIRPECVLDQDSVQPAIIWFLDKFEANPSLIWISFMDAFQAI